jgi:hypothetical protein
MGYQNQERPDEPVYQITEINYDLTDLIEDLKQFQLKYAPDGGDAMKRIIKNIKFTKDSLWKLEREMFPPEMCEEDEK